MSGGEAYDAISVRDVDCIASAIGLERLAPTMRVVTVDLEDELVLGPQRVDLVAVKQPVRQREGTKPGRWAAS